MKFFEKINDFTMKIAKGMLVIFVIKLTLFTSVFIFQACSTDENLTSEIKSNEFKNALKISTTELNNINLSNSSNLLAKNSDGSKTIY